MPTPGYYIYTETSGPRTGSTYVLRTPLFDVAKGLGCQVRFGYNMYGASMGTLQVSSLYLSFLQAKSI